MTNTLRKVFLILATAALACNLSTSGVENTETTPKEVEPIVASEAPVGEPKELDCNQMGLPCSAGEVEPAVIQRSVEIQDEITSRLADGESIEDTQVWLEDHEGVRAVLTNPYGLFFILDGGIMFGVYDAVASTGLEPADSSSVFSIPLHAAGKTQPRPVRDIVGTDTDRENEDRNKSALILSPFEFEFEVPNVGPEAVQILEGIPDYTGRVQYRRNEQANVAAFGDWDQFDVILYNGHGGKISGTDRNTGQPIVSSFIVTGAKQDSCGAPGSYGTGIICIQVNVRSEGIISQYSDSYVPYLAVTPAFFAANYSGGLDKSVVILNACQTFIGNVLPDRLAGSNSVLFGWDSDVQAIFNPGVISGLLTELAKGVPSQIAFDTVCGSGGCVDSAGAGKGATLHRYGAGDDLRIREIVKPLHPITEDELNDGDHLTFYGYPGDGQVDELPFYVEISGVEFDQIHDFRLRFEVNGQPVNGSWPINDPGAVEKWESPEANTYRIMDRMLLPFDVQQNMPLAVVVIVDLPEGGESKSARVTAEAQNPVLDLQSYFYVEEEGSRFESIVTAEVNLSLKEITENDVIFESIGQQGLLVYDSFYVEVPNNDCSIEPRTTNGSLDVSEVNFIRNEITNMRYGSVRVVTLYPTDAVEDSFVASCQEQSYETPNLSFWFSSFNRANAGFIGDSGYTYPGWQSESGDTYGSFHQEIAEPFFDGQFTLLLRSP